MRQKFDPDTDTDSDPESLLRFVAESSLRHGSLERLKPVRVARPEAVDLAGIKK
jgi:hypothetical protein